MIEIIIRKNGVDLVSAESNEVQIIRCIKRPRKGQPIPEGGWPKITDQMIAGYAIAPCIPIGESWKKQMRDENDSILLEEIAKTPGDKSGAIERALARVSELDDPEK